MQAARAIGKRIGRPRSTKDDQIAELLGAGWTAERVRKHLNVGTSAVQRVRHKIKGQQSA